jgi:hypothetical protein
MNINSFQDQSTSQRQQTVYLRSWNRNIPSEQLQMYLDSRPASTKYAIMPIVDLRQPIKTPLHQSGTFDMGRVFYPGNDSAPWSGYSSNVNVESELRNQVYALQSCSQAVYVPSSNSNLYNMKWQNSNNVQQPFPTLFKEQQFQQFNPNMHPNDIGFAMFNNATRQQLKDISN